jgi:predicted kinase
MGERPPGPRLIIVCGLPGSGKTFYAEQLEVNVGAVRFCADVWIDAIGINLWDATARQRIKDIQVEDRPANLEAGSLRCD